MSKTGNPVSSWIEARTRQANRVVESLRPRLAQAFGGARIDVPDDLDLVDNGLVYEPGADRLDVLWFQVREREGGRLYEEYHAIRLLRLQLIPQDVRGDAGALAKMRTVLRGLYGSNTEIVYLVAGVYHPRRLGIVQCYGAIGRGTSLEDAICKAHNGAGALEGTMAAAYPQIRFESLDQELAEWIDDALQEMPHGLLVVGHPDPRENARGGSSELTPLLASGKHLPQSFTLQQNELMMRGMSELDEDFLLQAILTPLSLQSAARMLAGLAEYTSTWAAWQTGSRSFNFGASIPLLLSGGWARSVGSGYTETDSHSSADGVSEVASRSHTEGQAVSHTQGTAHTQGVTETHTEGQSVSQSQSTSFSESDGIADGVSHGRAVSDGTSQVRTTSHGTSSSRGTTSSHGTNAAVNGNLGAPGVASVGGNYGVSNSYGTTSSTGVTNSVSNTKGTSHTETVSEGTSHVESHGQSQGSSAGTAVTHSQSDSIAHSQATTHSESNTRTQSQADTQGVANGTSHTESTGQGTALARGLSRGISDGITVGLAPSASIGESNQWQFDPAILLTNILRKQQDLLNTMTLEGGFHTDVYALARTERGKRALMALIPEAFHGVEDVVMGVQTRDLLPEEETYIRLHAMAMVPSTREIHLPEAMTAYADSTLLTALQAAAYLAPGLFEEGLARTVQEKIPAFAFDPDLEAGIAIGRQYSSERGKLTESLLRLSRERHFHTAFIGDTGSGKSVTAERVAYESTLAWHFRSIVLDFGQGWRKALKWPGMQERVDIRQLYPGAVRPLRWNPLQIPKRITPGRYRTLLTELFANAGRMGPRQLGFLREALTRVYQNCGVLGADENRDAWETVRDGEEEQVINAARLERGLAERATLTSARTELEPFERQALAIYRSRRASLANWVAQLRVMFEQVTRARDQASRSSLQGVLLRLEQLAEDEIADLYGPGYDTLAIEDLGLLGPVEDPWGITVIEGGAEMDEFSKSALLSLIASILYLDAVVRRREALGGVRFPPLQIFFEEANKVLSGIDSGAASDSEVKGGSQTSQIFLDMWRDGRKYQIFLHVLAQTVSELPQGILSSCNNAFFGQTKDDKDRSAVLAHLAKNTKGFVNADYDRFIARMPVAMAIAKLGYTLEMAQMEPYLIRSLMLAVGEPSDRDILSLLSNTYLVNLV